MLRPEEFLRQECDNVEELLRDVLRYDYTPTSTAAFYTECLDRISILKEIAKDVDPKKFEDIRDLAGYLSTLSEQIALIERSHLGEFSWAFGDELIKLAEVISTEKNLEEATRFGKDKNSLFLITTAGGLTSYAVMREQGEEPSYKQRIFTIVIPRSLKHYVLLHTVLGHEIGHAVIIMPHLVLDLLPILQPIGQGKFLANRKALEDWLSTEGGRKGPFNGKVVDDLRASWIEEIFCDLFGLVVIGPAFLGALRSLFDALDPSHEHFDKFHPPHIWRFEIMRRAYQHLKWHQPIPGLAEGPTKAAIEKLNGNLLNFKSTRFDVKDLYAPGAIEGAVDAIVAFVKKCKATTYTMPSASQVDHLAGALRRLRPPVGQDLGSEQLDFLPVDFRHILHAGWISYNDDAHKDFKGERGELFSVINKLCDQALVQRQAVEKWLERERANGSPKQA